MLVECTAKLHVKQHTAAIVAALDLADFGVVKQGGLVFLWHITKDSQGKCSHCQCLFYSHVSFSGTLQNEPRFVGHANWP